MRTALIAAALLFAPSCGDPYPAPCAGDLEVTDADFGCLLDWPQAGGVRVKNRCGHQDEAEAILRDDVKGVQFPVGTILMIHPVEAMVKRRAGYDPANNDWEYLSLGGFPPGSRITERGRGEVKNSVGSCQACHAGGRDYDFVCRQDHGCPKLSVPHDVLTSVQRLDVRCLPH